MGREGDWACSGCGNRNYAFRCFCNRCKQPRLLVDNNTPSDSKWLPRIGDWICTGCTNNNYASREKCKKCGQPKEVAAMPAIAIPGASLPTHPNYFARAQGIEQKLNIGLLGNGALQQQLPLSSNWSLGEAGNYESQHADRYRLLQASTWTSVGNSTPGVPYRSQAHQLLPVPNGWRNGDWLCSCGFHNYSSRAQCKKCNASAAPASSSSLVSTPMTALGTKRLASEELVHDWDNKRLNAGHTFGYQQAYPEAAERMVGSVGNQLNGISTTFPSGNSMVLPLQVNLQVPHVPAAPTLLGKGAKQWRDGDWMCTNCNNHNYASRSNCNRCKTERDVPAQPVSVA
ncbi:uncharacterized protein LOC107778889 isoform X1 [Nicotiana tabacum]|uniref:Uncharacterized protein LOC107778889 isoform X1 n=1 Tax=Nicotiana tabacum TaxID=4097 RepID=A0A1S3YR57_TOBAC|nr:PREDICTED: uncharacterized protein LOC107778889 isoform X1 [Nicotiana tabacum]